MRILKPLSFFAIAALLTLAACKGFKNTPVGRFYHNMVAHYNGYFNANDKMTEIENALYDKTEDNYSTIISIFPMGKEADSKAFTADLDKSIVRCSKVITKHELSNWVDDAYLLVGKSYFYKRDYFAAMETFQYTALKFPNTIPGQEAMFWTIRCYIELNKLTDAQAQISEVKKIKNINPKIEYKLNVVMADYYMHSEEYKLAAEHLEKAMKFIPTRKYRLRYYFILGQLYAWVGENTKAVANYTQVVKRNASYDLTFQAKMGLAGLYATQNPKEKKNIRKYLDRLLKDTKNTQYLDQVYYQLAKIELGEGHKKQGIDFLKQSSAHSNAKNKFQKTMTLVMLADLYFKEPDYATAKNYYDSTLASLQKEYPKSEQFGKEKKIYSELSGHLYNINREDSLQKIAAMPEAERTKKILEIMEKEKQDAEQKKLDDAKQKKQQEDNKSQLFGGVNDDNGNSDDMNNQMMNNGGVNQMGNNQQNSGQNNQQTAPLTTLSGNNDWYFYSAEALESGNADFLKRWGKRPLQDDWRRKKTGVAQVVNKTQNTENKDTSNTQNNTLANNKNPETKGTNTTNTNVDNVSIESYTKDLPFTGSQKSLSNGKIELALYSAGGIYADKLDDKAKATIYYEELLKRFPDSKYGLKAHYTLYNIYSSAGNEAAAKVHKDFILNNYPTSEYAILIKSPEMLLKKYKSKSAAVLNALYERTFIEYKKGNCARVAQMADSSNIIEQNNFLLAKFDYLKTLCSFRTDTAADASAKQIDSLNSFIKKYPGSDMSLEAIKLITLIQERPKESMVIKDTTQKVVRTVPYQKADSLTHMFVCVLPFEKVNINMVKAKFSDYNRENFGKENLELTSIVIDDNRQAIVVKNFVDIKRTQNYFSTVQRDKDFFSRMGLGEQKYFYISDQNFTLFMKDKDADIYLKFFNEKYK